MKAALLHRAVRSTCIAFLLVLGVASRAEADNVFWQGRENRAWDHYNPFGDRNNWYTRLPLKGVAREPPDAYDTAIFARGAKSHFIRSSAPVELNSLLFLSDLKRYTIQIEDKFRVYDVGIFNQSPAPPRFLITDTGHLVFHFLARIKSGGHGLGKRSALIEIAGREGRLWFIDDSRGGDASVTNRGTVFFTRDSTAERMMITNVGSFTFGDRPVTKFWNKSTGGSARFVNGRQGTLDFSETKGRANDRNVTARSIYNDGALLIGLNTLTLEQFEQTGGGDLTITSSGTTATARVHVTGKAVLAGDLNVEHLNRQPGIYKILYAEGGRTGTFDLGNVNMGRLAYSEKEVYLIIE